MRFRRKHYRAQVDTRDCGVASLAMIYGYYGSYYSLATLREAAKTTQEGTTAFGLVKVSEELGFETRAIRADMSLFDMEELSYFYCPCTKRRQATSLLCGNRAR